MQTVSLSEVGGLTTEILARLGVRRLALLTSDKVVKAVALPYTSNQQAALELARQYVNLVNGDVGDAARIGRLRGVLQTKLTDAGALEVLRRGTPVAILLPPPEDKESAKQGMRTYLEHLGFVNTQATRATH